MANAKESDRPESDEQAERDARKRRRVDAQMLAALHSADEEELDRFRRQRLGRDSEVTHEDLVRAREILEVLVVVVPGPCQKERASFYRRAFPELLDAALHEQSFPELIYFLAQPCEMLVLLLIKYFRLSRDLCVLSALLPINELELVQTATLIVCQSDCN